MVTVEEKRWLVLSHYVVGPATGVLREFFKVMWHRIHHRPWDPTNTDRYEYGRGMLTCRNLFLRIERDNTYEEKKLRLVPYEWNKLQSYADPDDWDFTLLCKILLNSKLCYSINHRRTPEKAAATALQNMRNSLFGHKSNPSLSNEEFVSSVDRAVASLNALGGNISDQDRDDLKLVETAFSALSPADVEDLNKQRAHAQSPMGKLQLWLAENFQSPIPTPIDLRTPAECDTNDATVMGCEIYSASTAPQVPCIWLNIFCLDEDHKVASVPTPGVGINTSLIIGYDRKMRAVINRPETDIADGIMGDEVGADGGVSWFLGLSDGDLSKRHCRIFYKDDEWFIEKLGAFAAEVNLHRGGQRKQSVRSGARQKLLEGDQITINKTYRMFCHFIRCGEDVGISRGQDDYVGTELGETEMAMG